MVKQSKPGMLDLFSGIGGFTLGFRSFTSTRAYCDNDEAATEVLRRQMKAGTLDKAPIFPDVRHLHADDLPDQGRGIELISAGFPCQDISVAGHRAGLARGARSSLYKQVFRLVREFDTRDEKKRKGSTKWQRRFQLRKSTLKTRRQKPSFIFLEIVNGITSKTGEYQALLKALDELGYDAAWDFYSAAGVGACHKRKRWFLLAARRSPAPIALNPKKDVPLESYLRNCTAKLKASALVGADGDKSERQQAAASMMMLGNAVVPAQANKAFRGLNARLARLQQSEDVVIKKHGGKIPVPGAYVRSHFVEVAEDPENTDPTCAHDGPFRYDIKRSRGSVTKATTPIQYGKQTRNFLGTPRRMHARTSAPTHRALADFGTCVAYCKRLAKKVDPKNALVKHTFSEGAMGFPPRWTEDPDIMDECK